MTIHTLIDMHATNAADALIRTIEASADYMSAIIPQAAKELQDNLAEILAMSDDDEDKWQALYELGIDAEEKLNLLPGVMAGTEDGQNWYIEELSEEDLLDCAHLWGRHSDDRVKVYMGEALPLTVCGRHAEYNRKELRK